MVCKANFTKENDDFKLFLTCKLTNFLQRGKICLLLTFIVNAVPSPAPLPRPRPIRPELDVSYPENALSFAAYRKEQRYLALTDGY